MPPLSLGIGLGLSKGGRSWLPTDLGASLALWLRSDLGITAPGAITTGWGDQGPRGLHFTQAIGGSEPPYDTSGAFPAVVVGGAKWMQGSGAASAWRWLHEPSCSLYVVCASTLANPDALTPLLTTHDSGNNRGITLALEDRTVVGDSRARVLVSNGVVSNLDIQTASGAVPQQTVAIVEMKFAPAAAIKAAIYRDGIPYTLNVPTGTMPTGDPQGPARLGRFYTYTDGQPTAIYEVIGCSPALSVAQASRVRRYLGARYSLAITEPGL